MRCLLLKSPKALRDDKGQKQAGHAFTFGFYLKEGIHESPALRACSRLEPLALAFSANLSESRSVTRTLASLRLSRGIRQRSAERSTRASGTREMKKDSKVIFGCLIVCFMRAPEARVKHSARGTK